MDFPFFPESKLNLPGGSPCRVAHGNAVCVGPQPPCFIAQELRAQQAGINGGLVIKPCFPRLHPSVFFIPTPIGDGLRSPWVDFTRSLVLFAIESGMCTLLPPPPPTSLPLPLGTCTCVSRGMLDGHCLACLKRSLKVHEWRVPKTPTYCSWQSTNCLGLSCCEKNGLTKARPALHSTRNKNISWCGNSVIWGSETQ